MSVFVVKFKDGEQLIIDDIVEFEKDQINQILSIAIQYTVQELQDERYGKDLDYLTDTQKQTVLDVKDSIVGGVSSEQLYNNKVVRLGKHSWESIQ